MPVCLGFSRDIKHSLAYQYHAHIQAIDFISHYPDCNFVGIYLHFFNKNGLA